MLRADESFLRLKRKKYYFLIWPLARVAGIFTNSENLRLTGVWSQIYSEFDWKQWQWIRICCPVIIVARRKNKNLPEIAGEEKLSYREKDMWTKVFVDDSKFFALASMTIKTKLSCKCLHTRLLRVQNVSIFWTFGVKDHLKLNTKDFCGWGKMACPFWIITYLWISLVCSIKFPFARFCCVYISYGLWGFLIFLSIFRN